MIDSLRRDDQKIGITRHDDAIFASCELQLFEVRCLDISQLDRGLDVDASLSQAVGNGRIDVLVEIVPNQQGLYRAADRAASFECLKPRDDLFVMADVRIDRGLMVVVERQSGIDIR